MAGWGARLGGVWHGGWAGTAPEQPHEHSIIPEGVASSDATQIAEPVQQFYLPLEADVVGQRALKLHVPIAHGLDLQHVLVRCPPTCGG